LELIILYVSIANICHGNKANVCSIRQCLTLPNWPLEGDDDSLKDDLPQLARQEARGGGPGNDFSGLGSEGVSPDIASGDDSYMMMEI